MDGVLIDSSSMHYDTTIMSIIEYNPDFVIDTLSSDIIDQAIPTPKKLEALATLGYIDALSSDQILKSKQAATEKQIEKISINHELCEILSEIRSHGIQVAVVSNGHNNTVEKVLRKLGIDGLVDYVSGNLDVVNAKPHPEPFVRCMSTLGVSANDTIIFEDSPVGILAATRSLASVVVVRDPAEINSIIRRELNVY
jgi:HAD superfamily hydrolase (TIGR01509 family)